MMSAKHRANILKAFLEKQRNRPIKKFSCKIPSNYKSEQDLQFKNNGFSQVVTKLKENTKGIFSNDTLGVKI